MELTLEQKLEQQSKQAQLLIPITVLGLITGIIYASNTGKSKLGWAFVGSTAPTLIIGIILTLTDYGNPTK